LEAKLIRKSYGEIKGSAIEPALTTRTGNFTSSLAALVIIAGVGFTDA